jgi:hypothetical protein
MKNIKPLHSSIAAAVFVAAIVSYSGCTPLDSQANLPSAIQSTPAQHVSYQQPSKQPKLQESNDQEKFGTAKISDDPSLPRDINPDWRPLTVPW